MKRAVMVVVTLALFAAAVAAAAVAEPERTPDRKTEKTGKTEYAPWKNGPSATPDFFPIAVWLQDPAKAPQYKALGFNAYVGLWKGPTEEQLAELKKHGMSIFCDQNEVGLKHKDDPTIIGWMHGDEPDNAQSLGAGKGYGPPVATSKIIADYKKIKAADPTRPVMLNLGQGVAWDGWHGRGVRTNNPEDYAEYVKGSDIVSYDIYPAKSDKPHLKGNLWFVPLGVDRLQKWAGGRKIVWNIFECTPNADKKPSPRDVKAEVWMSLVHGSTGICYFVHQFKPTFIEAGLLAYPDMAKAVGETNKQIHELAPVLNSPTIAAGATVESSNKDVPVDLMVKRHQGATYVFAVAMRDGKARADFAVRGLPGKAVAHVLGEDRTIEVAGGRFADDFNPYDVHLYKIIPAAE